MTDVPPNVKRERRRGPDVWLRVLSFVSVFGWLIMLAAMIVFHEARPEPTTVTTRFHDTPVNTTWDRELARYLFYLMVLGFFSSIAGLVINARRMRRRYDQVRVNLVVLGVISLTGICAYVFWL